MSQPNVTYASDHSDATLRVHRWRTAANSISYVLPRLTPAMKILDVGCGPGTITVDIAKLVPQGHITGLEYTSEPLSQARAFAQDNGVSNVDFAVGDIHELDFPDNSFDVVHAHQVLQHIRDPIQALREMRRVAKPGGFVAVRESASMTWYPQSVGLAEWKDLYTRIHRAKGNNPDPGSWIHVWAREAGFQREEIECSAGTWCFSTPEERAWWSGSFADRVIKSDFARFAVQGGHCKKEDLEHISKAWRDWGADEDGWFLIAHGQIICHVKK